MEIACGVEASRCPTLWSALLGHRVALARRRQCQCPGAPAGCVLWLQQAARIVRHISTRWTGTGSPHSSQGRWPAHGRGRAAPCRVVSPPAGRRRPTGVSSQSSHANKRLVSIVVCQVQALPGHLRSQQSKAGIVLLFIAAPGNLAAPAPVPVLRAIPAGSTIDPVPEGRGTDRALSSN